MDEITGILKQFEDQPELLSEVKKAYRNGAGADELTALLTSKGIEIKPSQVEAVLATMQHKRIEDIAGKDLDMSQLESVAGGGTGVDCQYADDCDKGFKYYWCIDERCEAFSVCDEYWAYIPDV